MNKIFICAPEEGIRESLKYILSEYYELILTDTVSQCLACIENVRDAKIVLISVDSSKEFGVKAFKQLFKEHPKLKFVAIANQKSTVNTEEAIRSGAAGMITMPFIAEQVLATIKKFSSK